MPAAPPHRRGEAHLWLLFEEVLDELRSQSGRDRTTPWGPRWRLRYVADALASAGVLPRKVSSAIVEEFDDAMAVRGLLPPRSFRGRPFPADLASDAPPPPPDGAAHWFEAELERHLDLIGSYSPVDRPGAGSEALEILSAPARSFVAAGALDAECGLLDMLAASLRAVGYEVPITGRGTPPRSEWVEFLRRRPRPLTDADRSDHAREVVKPLGRLGDIDVGVRAVGWSHSVLEVDLMMRSAHGTGDDPLVGPILCRAMDDRGRLHLGQSGVSTGGFIVRFRLRPGLDDGVRALELTLTAGPRRLEGCVSL